MTANLTKITTFTGIGLKSELLVGPNTGQQYYFLTYSYDLVVFDLVVCDPTNNYAATQYVSPLNTEIACYVLLNGPDNNIYLATVSGSGTTPSRIMKFDPVAKTLTVVGSVPNNPGNNVIQQYSWDGALSPYDSLIYLGTYPSADLVRFNPTSTVATNLGTADSGNQYIRWLIADPNPAFPYIYMGTGSINPKIVAYNISTNTFTTLVTTTASGFGQPYISTDGLAYANNIWGASTQSYSLSNGVATPTGSPGALPSSNRTFANGDKVNLSGEGTPNPQVKITHPNSSTNFYPFTYTGSNIALFRLGMGPDKKVYISSIFPNYLLSIDPNNLSQGITNLANLGSGESYSLLAYNTKLYIGAYSSSSALLAYDPTRIISPSPYPAVAPNPNTNPNPLPVSGSPPTDWRPMAIAVSPAGLIYLGSIGEYGQLNGHIIEWDPVANTYVDTSPLSNHSIISFVILTNVYGVSSGLSFGMVGSTMIYGGGGTTPTASHALLFTYDMSTRTLVNSYSIPNAPNADIITSLVYNPLTGLVYGTARLTNKNLYVFSFDPVSSTFVNGGVLQPFTEGASTILYNVMTIGSDGNLWGVADAGIFTVNINTLVGTLIQSTSTAVTGGFVYTRGNPDQMYFSCLQDLYVYTLNPHTGTLANDIVLNYIDSFTKALIDYFAAITDTNLTTLASAISTGISGTGASNTVGRVAAYADLAAELTLLAPVVNTANTVTTYLTTLEDLNSFALQFFPLFDLLDTYLTLTMPLGGINGWLTTNGLQVNTLFAQAFNYYQSVAVNMGLRVSTSAPVSISSANSFPYANVDPMYSFTCTGATTLSVTPGSATSTQGGGTVPLYIYKTNLGIGAGTATLNITYINGAGNQVTLSNYSLRALTGSISSVNSNSALSLRIAAQSIVSVTGTGMTNGESYVIAGRIPRVISNY